MAIVREQYKVGQDGPVAHIHVTFDNNVKAGSLLLCCVSAYADTSGRTYTVSDGVNSWTDIYDVNYYGNDCGVLSYAMNAAAGATTVTVTQSASTGYFTVVIIEVSGILTALAKDQNNMADTSGANWDSGNITTTVNDEYLVGMLAVDNGDLALTEDGAWTLIYEEETGSTNMPISVSERIVSSTLTESYSGTIAASSNYMAAIASFKALAGTASPSGSPSHSPSHSASASPSKSPSASPSKSPSASPSEGTPSASPSKSPSASPSKSPSASPSKSPSASPSEGTPSASPSHSPSASPSEGTPSGSPSHSPSASPSATPSASPSKSPSASPSKSPSASPSKSPSASPSEGTPSASPSKSPSASPSEGTPSASPSHSPSASPSEGTPSKSPSASPSASPSEGTPSASPSKSPSASPSKSPSASPSEGTPSGSPSKSPSASPSEGTPSASPSGSPSATPSASPSASGPAPVECPVCWGHVTGVTETALTFAGNWAGTGAIAGVGDAETIELNAGEYMISEVVNTGSTTVTLEQNHYDPTGDDVDMDYRHGATVAACYHGAWNNYAGPFASLGYIQVRLTSTL